MHEASWKEYFSVILGSDQVKSGKPAPYLFEEAAKRMGVNAAHCLVIEDSLVGVKAANAAKMKVVVVPSQSEAEFSYLADSVLHSLLEFQPELWGLPPFEDWIDKALPIEPIHLSSVSVSGSVCEVAASAFGQQIPTWLMGTRLKQYQTSMYPFSMHICAIDGKNDHLSDQQIQLLLVGYIRELNNKFFPIYTPLVIKELEKRTYATIS
ncbi:Bifunctional riboflavin kinase/FMN phosphatase [Morella rubra]|uniref:Bifunctional riboflavin kinase/FMN phosphatase n=1 Tax=Morella rubra TaxID=262757 RepID=A0A6A1VAJ5_9ROSI|nr:Bifunctional riboflavin kinase/FMN phosphatase [Morella rubra]